MRWRDMLIVAINLSLSYLFWFCQCVQISLDGNVKLYCEEYYVAAGCLYDYNHRVVCSECCVEKHNLRY